MTDDMRYQDNQNRKKETQKKKKKKMKVLKKMLPKRHDQLMFSKPAAHGGESNHPSWS